MIQPLTPLSFVQEGINYLDPNPGGEKTILLLHGLGADCESWPWQMTALAQAGCRPIALDLPGFGKSPRCSGRWTIKRTAGAVFSFMNSLGLSHVSLAGISMGGTIAIQMALDCPELIDKLVLINTFARLQPKSPSQAMYFLKRFFLVKSQEKSEQAEYVAQRIFPQDGQEELREALAAKILEADAGVYQEAMVSLAFFRAMKRISSIDKPALVISGECDTTVALENQKALAAAIPGAQHVIIPGGGHGVTIDHPEEVNAALLAFILG